MCFVCLLKWVTSYLYTHYNINSAEVMILIVVVKIRIFILASVEDSVRNRGSKIEPLLYSTID